MQRMISRTRNALSISWSDRRAALARDIAMLTGRTKVSPIVRRSLPLATPLALGARWLTIVEVVAETRDAVTLVFEPSLPAWAPGQFLTVHVDVAGERLRRAYSLCTRPGDPRGPAITVKRIAGGKVSSFLVAEARVGMRLEVRGPSGQFVLPSLAAASDAGRHVLLVGGGSGITPLVALAEEVLERGARATLLYGNRTGADIIFRDRLAALVAASQGRLQVRHVLEDGAGAEATVGRLDADLLARELAELSADGAFDAIFSCGPAPMMDALRAALATHAIDPSVLHEERFQSLGAQRGKALPTSAQSLRITVGGRTSEVLARGGTTVLEAALAAGLPMPFSCTMGGCGACRVKLQGEVVHDTPNGLSAEEAAAGYAFACIARPLGPCVVVV